VRALAAGILVVGIAITGFAAENNIDLANIDKGVRLEIIKKPELRPEVLEKYEYYEINGNDATQLRREMSRNGIKWGDGKTYDALTTWNIKWDYDCKSTESRCRIDALKTKVNIVFRYPKWAQTDSASQQLLTRWNSYMANLITHENGHRDMAIEHTADFARAASELSASSCDELDRKVEALGNERMAKLNADERDYDAVTVHGTTQGAVFP
jgi:predicted secreted Zn-dependent protease